VPNPSNPQNFNWYGYVLNNPVNAVDPSGHSQCRTKEDCEDMGTTPMGSPSGNTQNQKFGGKVSVCSSSICNPSGIGSPPRMYGPPAPIPTATYTPTPIGTPMCSSPSNNCAMTLIAPTNQAAATATQLSVNCAQNTTACIGPIMPTRTPASTSTPFLYSDVNSYETGILIEENAPFSLLPSERIPVSFPTIYQILDYAGKVILPALGYPASTRDIGTLLSGQPLMEHVMLFLLTRGTGIFIVPNDIFYQINPVIKG